MRLRISQRVREKLRDKHDVRETEVEQVFINRWGGFLIDDREQHKTDPVTEWFIAETDTGRLLKIAFMNLPTGITVKSAFEPNSAEIRLYEREYARP